MKTEEIIELLVQEIAKLPEGTESTIAREVSKLGIDVTDKELFDIDYKTIEKLDEKRILLDKSKYAGQCIGLSFNIPFVVRKENYGEAVKRVKIVSMNVEELEKLCQENNAEAMNELANAGFGKAYYYLADMYYYGDGVERDYKKAQENLEKSVIKKEFVYDSRYRLGMMYLEGKAKEIDYSKADQYFREILDENYDDAYYKLAYVLEKYEKEGKEAKQYYEKIELDFCMLLIYYMLSYKDTANMNELKELLNLSRIELKNSALNDWLKKYYDRLSYLSDEEYQEIVSRVESKMQNKKKIDFSKIASDENVKQVAKKIIK